MVPKMHLGLWKKERMWRLSDISHSRRRDSQTLSAARPRSLSWWQNPDLSCADSQSSPKCCHDCALDYWTLPGTHGAVWFLGLPQACPQFLLLQALSPVSEILPTIQSLP